MNTQLLDRKRSVLVVIDFQEKLFPHVYDHGRILARVDLLICAAKVLGVPIILTEQYPKGLGPTIPEIRSILPDVEPLTKMDFSCVPAPGFSDRFSSLHRDQVVLTGIEAHVCVAQTALDLAAQAKRVIVLADAVSSRRAEDAQIALRRLEQGGLTISTAEAVVFEWLRRAGTEEFKSIQPKLKALQ